MALRDLIDLVVMASVASISGICARVTGLAGHLACSHTMVKRETMCFEHGWLPGGSGVACIAFQAKRACMAGRFLVAGRASRRRAVELLVSMALSALERGVCTIENKESVMAEVVHPVDPIVAGGARRTVLGNVRLHKSGVMLGVASCTGRLVVFLHIRRGVAGGTGNGLPTVIFGMQAQGKANRFMVESSPINACRRPGYAVMTVSTGHPKHPGMLGWLLVAGNAVRLGLIEYIILMAVSARDLTVFTRQGKIRLVMVES